MKRVTRQELIEALMEAVNYLEYVKDEDSITYLSIKTVLDRALSQDNKETV